MRLKDRLAIVTGGSSGIGRAIAIALSNEGAYVVVSDIDQAPKRGKYHEKHTTTSTVDEISKSGGQGTFIQCDMSDENGIMNLIGKTIQEHDYFRYVNDSKWVVRVVTNFKICIFWKF